MSLEEAKALRAGLNRAIERVERFEHGVEGLIARNDALEPSADLTR